MEASAAVPPADGAGLPADPIAEVADEAEKAKPTEYHILQLVHSSGADETYKVVARNVKVTGGGKAALKESVTPTAEVVQYLAVPSRSMKLIPVSLQTTARVVIG